MANERPAESILYHQPSPGIVRNYFERNRTKITERVGCTWILDSALMLGPFYTDWDGTLNIQYAPGDVVLTKDGPDVPPTASRLWRIWQEYTNSDEGKSDRNDPKMHLHSFRIDPDGKLYLRGSDFDWHRMRLGLLLRDGKLSERYRDAILPTKEGNTFTFRSVHPNNTNSHSVVITSDNHLIVATRGRAVDYYAGYTAATVEQQTNPQLENSPFDTYKAAVSKLNGMRSELNLTVRSETLRLGAIFLEPDVNCAAFLVVGKVEEDSSQIDPSIIGRERAEEFSPEPNSVWTLPLEDPQALVEQFWRPHGYLWHGTARLRIVAALSYIHGYEEAMGRLYRGYQESLVA